MTRCDTIRAKWAVEAGTKCNCWQDAYTQLFGYEPLVDVTLTNCGGEEATTEAATTEAATTSGGNGGKDGKGGKGRIGGRRAKH